MDNYGTHQRLLLRAALRTTGPMLELGTGWYSTPLLHEVAVLQRRFLLSHDNDPDWMQKMQRVFYHPVYHRLELLNREAWKTPWQDIYGNWGLAFIDHGPRPEEPRNSKGLLNALDRAQAVLDLMDHTDVFVLHDTEPAVRWEYDWDKVLPLFRYQYTDTSHDVHTTILSNKVDVREWS
jgi:hypothetical protein